MKTEDGAVTRAQAWLARRRDSRPPRAPAIANDEEALVEALLTEQARLREEIRHWQTCSNCGETMDAPGHCTNAETEATKGFALMHEEALTRAEAAEAEVTRLTREMEKAKAQNREWLAGQRARRVDRRPSAAQCDRPR